MKKKYLKTLIFFLLGAMIALNAQTKNTDALFLISGEILEVTVKKVGPETITYSYPGEDLENVVEKLEVEKIIFKNGREQLFSKSSVMTEGNLVYPPTNENEGAILPFEYFFDGTPSPEEGIRAQEYYYNALMKKPERNLINYQDLETTENRLRKAGILEFSDLMAYDKAEIARILGVGFLITATIRVQYKGTSSYSNESSTAKVNTKKKRVEGYSSEYGNTTEEFGTQVVFRIYDMEGNRVVDETRSPFMGSTKNSYISALSYLMKRTPYYNKDN